VVQIAPSGYYLHAARARQPERRSIRAQQDELLCEDIKRVWEDNMQCYGVVKVWKQLRRDKVRVARCTVARLMRIPANVTGHSGDRDRFAHGLHAGAGFVL
jgi:hypothetical protein